MTILAEDLLAGVGLRVDGRVAWGRPIPSNKPGVYVITQSGKARYEAPIDVGKVRSWMDIARDMTLDGKPGPEPADLTRRLAEFWLSDEPILYVGLAGTSLRNRTGQFVRHVPGYNKPHSGGYWLKLLSDDCLGTAEILWSECAEPDVSEFRVLSAFARRHGRLTPDAPLDRLVTHLPYANLEIKCPNGQPAPGGVRRMCRKPHGLGRHTIDPAHAKDRRSA